jgi:hypothetical protein
MEGTNRHLITWRKSSFSESHGGSCVEIGPTADAILVRDTKNRSGGTLAFTATTWRALTATLADRTRR